MNSFIRLVMGRFNCAIAILGLTIGFLVLNSTSALAETSVTLDTANDLVKVATVCKTKPNNQTEVLSEVLEFEESTLRRLSSNCTETYARAVSVAA